MMPPSPLLSARITSVTYFSDTTSISDQKIVDRPPRTFAAVSGMPCLGTERLLDGVQRAGADVAVDHAQREQGKTRCRLPPRTRRFLFGAPPPAAVSFCAHRGEDRRLACNYALVATRFLRHLYAMALTLRRAAAARPSASFARPQCADTDALAARTGPSSRTTASAMRTSCVVCPPGSIGHARAAFAQCASARSWVHRTPPRANAVSKIGRDASTTRKRRASRRTLLRARAAADTLRA